MDDQEAFLKLTWTIVSNWQKSMRIPARELVNPGATEQELEELEQLIGMPLPGLARRSLKICNGQPLDAVPLAGDFRLMSVDEIITCWTDWKVHRGVGEFAGLRPRVIEEEVRERWWIPEWIPFAENREGEYFCLDMNPTTSGTRGQVIRLHLEKPLRRLDGHYLDWIDRSFNQTTHHVVHEFWEGMEMWLKEHHPEGLKGLNPPAREQDIERLESVIGVSLPAPYRKALKIHNGQQGKTGAFTTPTLLMDMGLFSIEQVEYHWKFLKSALDKGMYPNDKGQINAHSGGVIQPVWYHPHWIPFAGNADGEYLCIDLAPGPFGRMGQVIEYDDKAPDSKFINQSFGFATRAMVWSMHEKKFKYDMVTGQYEPGIE